LAATCQNASPNLSSTTNALLTTSQLQLQHVEHNKGHQQNLPMTESDDAKIPVGMLLLQHATTEHMFTESRV